MATLKITAAMLNVDTNELIGAFGRSFTVINPNEEIQALQITTTERNIVWTTDVSLPGSLYLENQDATNFIQVGFATTVYPIKLEPGDIAMVPLDVLTLGMFCKADTANCRLLYHVTSR